MNDVIWWKWLVMVCALALSISGCVSTDLIQQMEKDIDALQAQSKALKQDVQSLEERLDTMEADIEASHQKTAEPPREAAGIDVPETEPIPESQAEGGVTPPSEGNEEPAAVTGEALYAKAQALFTEQRYREAARVFSQAELLDDAPEFKARCNYWIGECMYSQGAYERALEYFGKVFVKYGTTAKAPDALLKIGFTYYEMQNYNGARQALKEFLVRFPDHRAVPFAEERLRWIDNLESDDSNMER